MIIKVWTVIVKNLEVSKVLRIVYNYATAGGKFAQTIVPINITSRINETIILAYLLCICDDPKELKTILPQVVEIFVFYLYTTNKIFPYILYLLETVL